MSSHSSSSVSSVSPTTIRSSLLARAWRTRNTPKTTSTPPHPAPPWTFHSYPSSTSPRRPLAFSPVLVAPRTSPEPSSNRSPNADAPRTKPKTTSPVAHPRRVRTRHRRTSSTPSTTSSSIAQSVDFDVVYRLCACEFQSKNEQFKVTF